MNESMTQTRKSTMKPVVSGRVGAHSQFITHYRAESEATESNMLELEARGADRSAPHKIDGRTGQWLAGYIVGSVGPDRAALIVLRVLASGEGWVVGDVVFPERGSFEYRGSLQRLAELVHEAGPDLHQLCRVAVFKFVRD